MAHPCDNYRYYHINPALLAQRQAASLHHLHHPFLFLPPTTTTRPGHHGPKAARLPSPLANLQELSLFLNEMGDTGAAGLALGLVQGLLPSLRELDVSANRLSPAGVAGIVSALEALHRSGLRSPPPPPPPAAAAPSPSIEAKAKAKQAAAAAGAPLVDLSFNLLPEERGAVSHAALPQGVLI